MFYFYSILIVLYNLFLYAIFRSGIYDYLRLSKMSKSNIKKCTKGFMNYWFFQSINKQMPLGILYDLNGIFLIFTAVFTLLTVSIGYIKMFQPVLLVISVLLCLIEIPAVILESIYANKIEYGRAFVFFAKRKHSGGYTSSLLEMLSWVITASLICLAYRQL